MRRAVVERRRSVGYTRWLWKVGVVAAAAIAVVSFAGFGGRAHAAQVFTVNVDGRNPKANEAFIAYYPSTVRVHPGDTVRFHMVGNGEPHTVTLGTLPNAAIAGFEKLTPKQLQAQQPPKWLQKLDAKVPQLLPQGPGDAVQASANPCFIATGQPPAKTACAKEAQPAFDGTQSFYNSGWLASNQKFTVHLSSSIAPGTYRFMCLLHREGMSGKIVVVPSSKAVQSPSAQYAAGQKLLASIEKKLQPTVGELRHGQPPIPAAKVPARPFVLAGLANQAAEEASITEFGPAKVKIPVGGSVTWYFVGAHSLTFNSNKTDDDIRAVAPDGSVHINPKAAGPANAPGEPPPSNGGNPNGPPTLKVVAHKTWNGRGFLNTGVFANSFGPPVIEGYTITFTRAGTYRYICTVHDRMKGEIDVG